MEISELVDSLSSELVEDYAMASGEDVYDQGRSLAERVTMVSWNPRRGVLSGTVTSVRGVRQKVKVSVRGGLDGRAHAASAVTASTPWRFSSTSSKSRIDTSKPTKGPLRLSPLGLRHVHRSAQPSLRRLQRPLRCARPGWVSRTASPAGLVEALVTELSSPGSVQRIGVLLTQLEHSRGVVVGDVLPLVRLAHLGSSRRQALPGVAARVNGLVSRHVDEASLGSAGAAYLGVVSEGGASVESSLWVGMSDRLRQEVLDVLHEARVTLPAEVVGPVQEVLEARALRDSRLSELLRLIRSDPRGGRDRDERALRAKVVTSAARYASIVT